MTTLHRSPQTMAEMPASLASVWQDLTDPARPLPPYVAFTKGAIDGLLSIAKNVWVEGNIHPLDDEWRQRIMASPCLLYTSRCV